MIPAPLKEFAILFVRARKTYEEGSVRREVKRRG